ncbi:MAG: tRNA pseudouridine(38-40) synthase TruA [Ignavibacterium sp.]|uniref:tRNA pseudouridine(38-40) synthase TruA n=1 Tax=Ignavibacterium sp. TaxID=2651167 RepID=UPI00404B44B3
MRKKKNFSAKKNSTAGNNHKKFSRFKLYIEYEGTRYSGWQKQNNARTVQGELIKACRETFSENFIDLQGSGRTDSGVHAICQVAHLDVQTVLAPEIIKLKLNDNLPHDINILEIEKTNQNFHARHSAKRRSYIYAISRRRTAFGKNFVWWIKDKLNFNAMKKASELFLGMHNFDSFSDDDPDEKSTRVLIDEFQIKEEGDLILIRITGSHFIWKMVRRIVGVLVEVGRGKKSEEDILYYLNNKTNEPAKFTAPPSGLFLERVYYDEDTVISDFNSLIRVDKFLR